MTHARSTPNGFTLVELLVAMAIMGLLSTAAAMLISGASKSYVTSEQALAQVSGLEAAYALLAADLGQALNRPSIAPDGKLQPAFTMTPEGFLLVRGGVVGQLPSVQKIAWGFDGHALVRQSFTAIDGGEPGATTVVLPNVSGLQVRVADEKGWRDNWPMNRIEELPLAVELTLLQPRRPALVMKFLVAA